MKFGMFYEVQVPRPAPPGAEHERLREIVDQVVLAEEMGFEHVWFVEHHFLTEWAHSSASEVMLAVLSQHTTKMRLGFGVVLLPIHHPLHVAVKTATLDIMSGGRVDVGVGRAGNPYQLTPFGIDLEDTRGIWEESLRMIPNIWTQEIYSHEGKYFNIPEREVIPKPMQKPHPPLYSACSQEDTFQLAGEMGLGCLCNVLGQYDTVEARIKIYKEALKTANPVGKFITDNVVVSSIGFCDENKKRTLERGAEIAAWNINIRLSNYERGWSGVDTSKVPDTYRDHVRRMEWDPQMRKGVTPEEVLSSGRFCVGTPDECIEVIENYERIGADEIMPIFQAGPTTDAEVKNSLRLFGKYVIPHFKEKERRAQAAAAATADNG
ncbi:MAG: LLM class flavin-dependent oxidoreductase [Chloroflexi bacterium]|nr:LLM class flavin-dependent oxidoreductase [Chloroflexota bacterium]